MTTESQDDLTCPYCLELIKDVQIKDLVRRKLKAPLYRGSAITGQKAKKVPISCPCCEEEIIIEITEDELNQ
ncbi:MAG: hypothetical protein ACI8WB_005996 [Phenylobacterium sp.]|jgi:hypothetical protein